MKIRNFFIILLLLCVLFTNFGCEMNGNAHGDSPDYTEEITEAVPDDNINLISADTPYKVVRSDYSDETVTAAAVKLKNALAEKYGAAFTAGIASDYVKGVKKNEVITQPGYEILVGETNRQQSVDALAELDDGEYIIKVVDDKIVIIGSNIYATSEAVDFFIENYINTAAADKLEISRTLLYSGVREETRPPLAEGATLRIMSYNLGCNVGVNSDAVTLISRYMPDLIGLQECNKAIHQGVTDVFIKAYKEYKYVQKYHSGTTTVCYTPIIYNSNKLTLVNGGVEWLRSRYTGTNTKSVCWAVFDTKDGQRFAMINFHGAVVSAEYTPYKSMTDSERSDLAAEFRYDNAKQMIEIKDRIIAEHGDIPVTVNGDCNFNCKSSPFTLLTSSGFRDAEQTADKKTNQGYRTYSSYGSGLPGKGDSIDHIFGFGTVYFAGFKVILDKEVTTASDHCPIYADYNPFGKQ